VPGKGTSLKSYQKDCRDYLRSVSGADCFVGTPRPEDLRSAKYPLILQPLITAEDAESHVHALERREVPTQKGHSAYMPIRFAFEKISNGTNRIGIRRVPLLGRYFPPFEA